MSDDIRQQADSSVQRDIAASVIERLAAELGAARTWLNRRLPVGGDQFVEVNGCLVLPTGAMVAIETYISLGPLRSAQQSGLREDILKLALLGQRHPHRPRGLIVVTSREAEAWLRKGWVSQAIKTFEIEVRRMTLSAPELARLESIRAGQARANVAKA